MVVSPLHLSITTNRPPPLLHTSSSMASGHERRRHSFPPFPLSPPPLLPTFSSVSTDAGGSNTVMMLSRPPIRGYINLSSSGLLAHDAESSVVVFDPRYMQLLCVLPMPYSSLTSFVTAIHSPEHLLPPFSQLHIFFSSPLSLSPDRHGRLPRPQSHRPAFLGRSHTVASLRRVPELGEEAGWETAMAVGRGAGTMGGRAGCGGGGKEVGEGEGGEEAEEGRESDGREQRGVDGQGGCDFRVGRPRPWMAVRVAREAVGEG